MKPRREESVMEDPRGFERALVRWYEEGKVDYPWRRTEDPYAILVSEVMLQQTTVQAVVENRRYERFLERFPSVVELAEASEEEILREWEGLGYYNRVRNLQKTARAVIEDYGGAFPAELEALKSLPGVGPYTAGAVASFAFNLSAPLVDANVLRVFARLFDDDVPVNTPAGQKVAWKRAAELVSPDNARAYNAALMELGQKVCRHKEAHCLECPVARYCATSRPNELPVKLAKKKATEIVEHALWCQEGDRVYMVKGDESRRKGMWRLPLVNGADGRKLLHEAKYTITTYKVTLKVYEGDEEVENGEWVPVGMLEDLPMPSPIRKVVARLVL